MRVKEEEVEGWVMVEMELDDDRDSPADTNAFSSSALRRSIISNWVARKSWVLRPSISRVRPDEKLGLLLEWDLILGSLIVSS